MKTSELILTLTRLAVKYGDLNVTAHILDDEVENVSVIDSQGVEIENNCSAAMATEFFLQ